MSADNWTRCPKCFVDVSEIAQKELNELYGKIPLDEWKKKFAEVAKMSCPDPHTLREDYELGLQGKKFYVIYKCHCTNCHWGYQFSHESYKLPGLK